MMSRAKTGKGTLGKGSKQPETTHDQTHDQKGGECPFLTTVNLRNGATFTGCGLGYLLLNVELESEPIQRYRKVLTQAVGGDGPFELLRRMKAYPCPGYNPSDGSFIPHRAARYCPIYVGKRDDGVGVFVSERMENVLEGVTSAYKRNAELIRKQYEQIKRRAETLGIKLE